MTKWFMLRLARVLQLDLVDHAYHTGGTGNSMECFTPPLVRWKTKPLDTGGAIHQVCGLLCQSKVADESLDAFLRA